MALFSYVQRTFFDPRGGGANFQGKTDRMWSPGTPTEAGIRAAGWWQGPGGWRQPPGRQVLPWLWREHPRASGICSVLRTTSVEPQQTQAMAQGAGNTHKRGASSRAPLKRSTLIPRHEMPARPRKGLQDASDGSWSWPCPGPWALRSRVAITANSSSVSRLRCSVFSLFPFSQRRTSGSGL